MFQNTGERYEQASLEKNKLECRWFLFLCFFSLFHNGKHQYCIHVSAVCFSNVCSNRRSTSLLAFVALTAFKNKCPVTVRRGHRSSNLFLLLTGGRAHPNGRAQILWKDQRHQSGLCVCDGKAKSIILQDSTHILSALNSVSFLYDYYFWSCRVW